MLERGLECGGEALALAGQSEESALSAIVGMMMLERRGGRWCCDLTLPAQPGNESELCQRCVFVGQRQNRLVRN